MDDLLSEFLTESAESIATLDVELVKLEQNPEPALISSIFRLVHTIKGTCGFIGLPRLETLAHSAENVLGKIRDGELPVTSQAISLILTSIDRIKMILSVIENTEAEPAGTDADLIEQLNALARGDAVEAVAPPAPAFEPVPVAAPAAPVEPEVQAAPAAPTTAPSGKSLFDRLGGAIAVEATVELFYAKVLHDATLTPFFANTDIAALKKQQIAFFTMALGGPNGYAGRDLKSAHARLVEEGLNETHFNAVARHLKNTLTDLRFDPAAVDEVMLIVSATKHDVLGKEEAKATAASPPTPPVAEKASPGPAAASSGAEDAAREAAKLAADADKNGESNIANQSIRVSVQLLENLMTTVSELVLTRNQLLQMVRSHGDSEFKAPLQRLSHITSDLQEGVMKTRMQPIGNAWAKLPRIVRSLAHDLSKKIDLEMVGAETELDRQVLELIKDPLTHMVRNSGDHGLETPAQRKAAGKSETGKIRLNAYHEGGHIIIEVADDGKGIDTARVRAKVLEKGLATESELETMSDQQILQFIFGAGFSTAQQVTSVSGRGVGMDVVRTNIERIGGTIDLRTQAGKGSTFTIKIPLTLAIVSALIVEAGGERFAIPQISVVELVRTKSDSEHKIEVINGTPVLRLRNRLLPLVSLSRTLGLDGETRVAGAPAARADLVLTPGASPSKGVPPRESFIVVTQVGAYTFGIIVDRVFDTEEIVVKPVSPILRHISMFSGNTILGDGSVIMILDPNGIAAASGQRHANEGHREEQSAKAKSNQSGEKVAMLLFNAGSSTPKAVPLSLVARLEEIDATSIEQSDGRPVVQYRGQLMPLIAVDPGQSIKAEGRQPVVVFTDAHRSMGLIVDAIIDIIEEELSFEVRSQQPGVLGSAVVGGKATDIIDVAFYLRQSNGDWFKSVPGATSMIGRHLLLVDDSPFFRNMLTPVLTAAGYRVTAAADADEALRLLEDIEGIDVIVSDIEMPGMNGFDFARACRAHERFSQTPIVALSSHTEPADFDRGRAAGFTDYVGKFDRDALLSSLTQSLELARGAA